MEVAEYDTSSLWRLYGRIDKPLQPELDGHIGYKASVQWRRDIAALPAVGRRPDAQPYLLACIFDHVSGQ